MTESWLQASRLLTRWRRDRTVLLGSLLLPIGLLFLYQTVLGERVRHVTGVDSLHGLVPVSAVLCGLFGAMTNAVGITIDRESGLFGRMWVLPVHRASALTGRLIAEAIRALLGTILITVLGVLMGLRFTHGWGAALVYVLIPSILVVEFTALSMALVIRNNGRTMTAWLSGGTIALAFLNPGTTPIGQYPGWLQPFVRMQPISPPVEAMRALTHDGALIWPLTMTMIWAIVSLAIFIPLAVRSYRRAAESTT